MYEMSYTILYLALRKMTGVCVCVCVLIVRKGARQVHHADNWVLEDPAFYHRYMHKFHCYRYLMLALLPDFAPQSVSLWEASSSISCAKSNPTACTIHSWSLIRAKVLIEHNIVLHSCLHTVPLDPTASASRKVMSPLPQHRSKTVSPGLAPLHFTASLFHSQWSPRLSKSFSCSQTPGEVQWIVIFSIPSLRPIIKSCSKHTWS